MLRGRLVRLTGENIVPIRPPHNRAGRGAYLARGPQSDAKLPIVDAVTGVGVPPAALTTCT